MKDGNFIDNIVTNYNDDFRGMDGEYPYLSMTYGT